MNTKTLTDEIKVLKEKNFVQDFDDVGPYIIVRTSNMLCPFLAIGRIGIGFLESKTVFTGILPIATDALDKHEILGSINASRYVEGIGFKLEPFTMFTKKIRFTSLGRINEEMNELIRDLESSEELVKLIRKLKPEIKVSIEMLPDFVMSDKRETEHVQLRSMQIAWFITVSKLITKGFSYKGDIYSIIELIELIAKKLHYMDGRLINL